MSDSMNQIGTVRLLKERVYPLDTEADNASRSTVLVKPGVYKIYSDGMTTFWMLRGKLNMRGVWRMGEGMFGLYEGDSPSEIEVVFPSKRYGPDEWAEFLTDPMCADGPDQRLKISLLSHAP